MLLRWTSWWLLNIVSLVVGLSCVMIVYDIRGSRVCGVPLPIYVVEDGKFFTSMFALVSIPADFLFGFFAPRLLIRLLFRKRAGRDKS